MQAVYYCTKSGKIPAKESLNEYLGRKTTKNPDDLVVRIDRVISLALERNGVPGGNFSSLLLSHRPLREFKIDRGSELIRINYCCCGNWLVLFNFYVKKGPYPPKGKEARRIERIMEEASNYYQDFVANQNQYEKY